METPGAPQSPELGQVFFLHIPKTAGISLNHLIESHFDRDAIFPTYATNDLLLLTKSTLEPYRYFRGHIAYGILRRLLHRPPVSITMLRDPVDRALSQLAFLRENPELPIQFDRGWLEQLSIDEV